MPLRTRARACNERPPTEAAWDRNMPTLPPDFWTNPQPQPGGFVGLLVGFAISCPIAFYFFPVTGAQSQVQAAWRQAGRVIVVCAFTLAGITVGQLVGFYFLAN